MKITYRLVGLKLSGDEMKLVLQRDIIKEKISATKAIGNLGGFMEQMKMDASKANNPDNIHVPLREFNEMNIMLGDLITLEVLK